MGTPLVAASNINSQGYTGARGQPPAMGDRALMLQQVRALRQQLAVLGEALTVMLADSSAGALQVRIAIQKQIQAIRAEIIVLENALLQKDGGRKVKLSEFAGNESRDISGATATVLPASMGNTGLFVNTTA